MAGFNIASTTRKLVVLTGLAAIPMASVQAENCSHPPFNETYIDSGSADWSTVDSDCVLASSLHVDAHGPAAGVAHFKRRNPEAPLRLKFKADLTALSGLNLIQHATISSGTSRTAYPTESPQAHLFRLDVFGNGPGTQKFLAVVAACQSNPLTNLCSSTIPLPDSTPTIGLELDVGAGTDGEIRIWVDKAFEETPSLTLPDLDNAGWIGTERIGLGLSSASASFRSAFGDQTVVFSAIEYNDDQLLWSDFESDQASNCNDPFVLPLTFQPIAGNTCQGTSNILPVLASGTTRGNSKEVIYTFISEGEDNPLNIQIGSHGEHDTSAFVCERACGPIQRCLGAVHAEPNETGGRQFQLPAGQYDFIVKSLHTCGDYTVHVQNVNE